MFCGDTLEMWLRLSIYKGEGIVGGGGVICKYDRSEIALMSPVSVGKDLADRSLANEAVTSRATSKPTPNAAPRKRKTCCTQPCRLSSGSRSSAAAATSALVGHCPPRTASCGACVMSMVRCRTDRRVGHAAATDTDPDQNRNAPPATIPAYSTAATCPATGRSPGDSVASQNTAPAAAAITAATPREAKVADAVPRHPGTRSSSRCRSSRRAAGSTAHSGHGEDSGRGRL